MYRRLLVVAVLAGCSSAAPKTVNAAGDTPIPADEPRAELVLDLSLAAGHDCEERFDLALYANRGVDLIQWRGVARGCTDRSLAIRYLPNKLSREKLMDQVREHAREVRIAAPNPTDATPNAATGTPR